MNNHTFYGPPPSGELLTMLGLKLPPKHSAAAAAWVEQAEVIHQGWYDSYERALSAVDSCDNLGEESAPRRLARDTILLEEGYRAGLRVWLHETYAVDLRVRTPADLLAWCRLQQTIVQL